MKRSFDSEAEKDLYEVKLLLRRLVGYFEKLDKREPKLPKTKK